MQETFSSREYDITNSSGSYAACKSHLSASLLINLGPRDSDDLRSLLGQPDANTRSAVQPQAVGNMLEQFWITPWYGRHIKTLVGSLP
jgi:hypothetical protein